MLNFNSMTANDKNALDYIIKNDKNNKLIVYGINATDIKKLIMDDGTHTWSVDKYNNTEKALDKLISKLSESKTKQLIRQIIVEIKNDEYDSIDIEKGTLNGVTSFISKQLNDMSENGLIKNAIRQSVKYKYYKSIFDIYWKDFQAINKKASKLSKGKVRLSMGDRITQKKKIEKLVTPNITKIINNIKSNEPS